MDIQCVTSFSVITPDPKESRKLFVEALGLPLKRHQPDDYYFSEEIEGARHFGVWPLWQAAEACFGASDWPRERAVPQASVEFEVADEAAVDRAAAELAAEGYDLLHAARTEPWGQVVARVQSLEGLIVGISYAPSLHEPG